MYSNISKCLTSQESTQTELHGIHPKYVYDVHVCVCVCVCAMGDGSRGAGGWGGGGGGHMHLKAREAQAFLSSQEKEYSSYIISTPTNQNIHTRISTGSKKYVHTL